MAFLDNYQGKGYIRVSALNPIEKKQLLGLAVKQGKFQKPITDKDFFVIGRGGSVSFSPTAISLKEEPPEKIRLTVEGEPPGPVPFTPAPVHFLPTAQVRVTKDQQERMIKTFADTLEKQGLTLKSLEKHSPITPVTQITTTRQVLTGYRKAAMVDERTAEQARQWGLIAFKVPHGSFTGDVARSKAYIIYLPGQTENAKKVVRILEKYPIGKRGTDYLVEMGMALGTPPGEVSEYIKTYYGSGEVTKKESNTPKWLGIIGIVIAGIVLLSSRRQVNV
jgi:hypothetical protein